MLNSTYPLVSIGIPTYNRADGYLKDAIQSALNQTHPNIEIIIADNCSIEDTETVVKAFADPRIRYHRHDVNIGPNENFNFCLKQARGDYFLLLHDDDRIDPDFVDVCMKAGEFKTDKGIIRTGTRIIDENGNLLNNYFNMAVGLSTEEFFRCWFDCKTALYLCSTLFNTERLKEIGGFVSKHNLFNDVFAEMKLAAKFGRADIKNIKASFRKHSGEITFSSKLSAWCEDSLMLLDVMCELVHDHYKPIIRDEGLRFLSKINYGFASKVESRFKRYVGYFIVCNYFNFKYLPPPAILFIRNFKRRVGKVV